MALRKIVMFGDSILNKKSRVVDKFDDRLAQLIDDMAETMYHENGVGLAAVQVGILKRVIVIDVGNGLLELVNPEIIKTEGSQHNREGCLSFPGRFGTTERPMKVQVKAQDRNGTWHIYTGEGLLAMAFCHETDHLDGVLFTAHLLPGEKVSM